MTNMQPATEPKIEIKNLKFAAFASQDSNCFQATIYVDGERAFVASDDGHGGCVWMEPVNAEGRLLMDRLEAWVVTQPPQSYPLPGSSAPIEIAPTLEFFIADLVAQELVRREEAKAWKRVCKKGVAFTTPDMEDGAYRILKGAKLTPAIKTRILTNYPAATILNEIYG